MDFCYDCDPCEVQDPNFPTTSTWIPICWCECHDPDFIRDDVAGDGLELEFLEFEEF